MASPPPPVTIATRLAQGPNGFFSTDFFFPLKWPHFRWVWIRIFKYYQHLSKPKDRDRELVWTKRWLDVKTDIKKGCLKWAGHLGNLFTPRSACVSWSSDPLARRTDAMAPWNIVEHRGTSTVGIPHRSSKAWCMVTSNRRTKARDGLEPKPWCPMWASWGHCRSTRRTKLWQTGWQEAIKWVCLKIVYP